MLGNKEETLFSLSFAVRRIKRLRESGAIMTHKIDMALFRLLLHTGEEEVKSGGHLRFISGIVKIQFRTEREVYYCSIGDLQSA